ncbi:syntenin-1-like [Sitodiplosis mosellana]|uniref:syntenin-1-like n=1 Tax=Sitodiplosis mosellana TaxID=263140 RepID=UPI002444FF64|nr:syntenin-1-like [Sitodiplosis mosellana]XP_055317630.1 syntenin-1-like [Sitodiplosis mosellana]
MSSLYPSLEDMQVHKMVQAQQNALVNQMAAAQATPSYAQHPSYAQVQSAYPQLGSTPSVHGYKPVASAPELYPGLSDFMGLELSSDMIALNMPEYMRSVETAVMPSTTGSMIAPLSSQTAGLQRAHVTHGIREVIVCKGADKKIGLRVKDINNGIFITLVCKDSPAALVGLRFGDQILQINGNNVAGFSMDKVHKILKKSPENDITMVIRDRPFERTVTMHKDSTGHIGFQFNNGKIVSIVKDSSAARNGLLIEHQLLEVNGQNVVGMKDKDITAIILNENEPIITVTIIPSFIYDHMVKKLSTSFIRSIMDHSVPDF